MIKFKKEKFYLGTYKNYAHPLSLAAFKGTIKFTEQKSFKENLSKNNNILKNWINNISPYIKEWRGKGFLYALVLNKEIPQMNL